MSAELVCSADQRDLAYFGGAVCVGPLWEVRLISPKGRIIGRRAVCAEHLGRSVASGSQQRGERVTVVHL